MVDMDGYPTITTESDGVYLTVYPPKGKGKAVDLNSIKKEIDKYSIKNINMDAVERAVKEATGKQVLIVEEKIAIKDGQVFINLTPDEMTAQLTVVPPQGGGKEVEMDDVQMALKQHNVIFGVKEDKIKVLLDKSKKAKDDPTIFLEPIEDVIAEGQNVQNGENAKLEFLFEQEAAKQEKSPEQEADQGGL